MKWWGNDWKNLHEWLMKIQEEIPEGPFPVLELVPRDREEWQEWYGRGLRSLREPAEAVQAAVQSLLENPHSAPRVECGRTRYLLRERLRCALCAASLLADLRSQSWATSQHLSADQDGLIDIEMARRWLLVDVWERHGESQWHGSILSAALATQALAGWRE